MSISEISSLHAPSVVEALLGIDRSENGGQNGKKSNKKENRKVLALRIPTSIVTKEVKKLRPCDLASCLYCREWASLALRRGFGSNVKNEPPKKSPEQDKSKLKDQRQEFIVDLTEAVEKHRLDSSNSSCPADFSFLEPSNKILVYIMKRVAERADLHASSNNLLLFFEMIDFNLETLCAPSWPQEEEVFPMKLLDAVDTSEKGTIILPRENFDTLKPYSASFQASLTVPVCAHSKESILPDQLKERVAAISLKLKGYSDQCAKDWAATSIESWGLFNNFTDSILKYELARIEATTSSSHRRCFQFHKELNEKPRSSFTDHWSQSLELFRKGQSGKRKLSISKEPLSTLDDFFRDFFDSFLYSKDHFNILLDNDIKLILNSVNELQDILHFWIGLVKTRVQRHTNLKRFPLSVSAPKKNGIDCAQSIHTVFFKNFNLSELPEQNILQNFFDQAVISVEDAYQAVREANGRLESRLSYFRSEKAKKEQSLSDQYAHVISDWMDPSLTSVSLKLEKASNKDYRKQIRRLELAYTTYRVWAADQVDHFFPMNEVADLVIAFIKPLLQEAQLLHLMNFLEFFYEKYEHVVNQHAYEREKAATDFHDGLASGLRMLGGIVGKFFLKEGLRIHEDFKAIEKQNELLQLWDLEEANKDTTRSSINMVDNSEAKNKKKNKKKKKKNGDEIATDTPNSPLEVEKPPSPLFANHVPPKPPVVAKVENVEPKPPVKTAVKADKVVKKEPVVAVSPKQEAKPLSTGASKVLSQVQSDLDKKLVKTLGGAEPAIDNLNAINEKITHGKLGGQETSVSLALKSRSNSVVQTAQGEVDLTTVSKEKLIVFVQSLLLDKSSLLEAFTSMKTQLDNVSQLYSSVLAMIQTQDEAITAQAQEIKDYQNELLVRDIELLKLVHQQNALRKAMLEQPEVRANLNALLANPSNILNSTLPSDFFLSETALLDDLDPSRHDEAPKTPKTPAPTKSKKGKNRK